MGTTQCGCRPSGMYAACSVMSCSRHMHIWSVAIQFS
jgi:hypothetical protein